MEFAKVLEFTKTIAFDKLEQCQDKEEIKGLLVTFFQQTNKDKDEEQILSDFYFYAYMFCKQESFDEVKSCTFLCVLKDLLAYDQEVGNGDDGTDSFIRKSNDYLQERLLQFCVDRPPRSALVFTEREIGKVFDYIAESYYRHFRLYQFLFRQKRCPTLGQKEVDRTTEEFTEILEG